MVEGYVVILVKTVGIRGFTSTVGKNYDSEGFGFVAVRGYGVAFQQFENHFASPPTS